MISDDGTQPKIGNNSMGAFGHRLLVTGTVLEYRVSGIPLTAILALIPVRDTVDGKTVSTLTETILYVYTIGPTGREHHRYKAQHFRFLFTSECR